MLLLSEDDIHSNLVHRPIVTHLWCIVKRRMKCVAIEGKAKVSAEFQADWTVLAAMNFSISARSYSYGHSAGTSTNLVPSILVSEKSVMYSSD